VTISAPWEINDGWIENIFPLISSSLAKQWWLAQLLVVAHLLDRKQMNHHQHLVFGPTTINITSTMVGLLLPIQ
jgi:hypothetical protein